MLSTAPIRAYIPAAHLARARKFYEEIVGLKPTEAYAGGVVYICGGAEVFMYQTSNAGTSKASQAFWQVKDVEKDGGAKTAWFKDSEGNIMAVSQRLQ